jgi:hypothetical protein
VRYFGLLVLVSVDTNKWATDIGGCVILINVAVVMTTIVIADNE